MRESGGLLDAGRVEPGEACGVRSSLLFGILAHVVTLSGPGSVHVCLSIERRCVCVGLFDMSAE